MTIFIGCVFSVLCFKRIISLDNNLLNRWKSLALFFAAILIRANTSIFYVPYLSNIIFDLLIGMIIVRTINADDYLSRMLKTRVLLQTGIISYSVYIWQQLFTYTRLPFLNKSFFLFSGTSLFLVAAFIRLIAIIFTGYISYCLIEKRLLTIKGLFFKNDILNSKSKKVVAR